MIKKTKRVVVESSPTWEVSAEGFETQTGTVNSMTSNTSLDVYLLGDMVVPGVKEFYKTSRGTFGYLTEYGELYLTGYNYYGQQGSGDTTNVTTFTKRADNVRKAYLISDISVYITNDDELYMCGYNRFGQHGSGDITNVLTFTKRADNVKEFYSDGRSLVCLTNNGEMLVCGENNYGQLGVGDNKNVLTFTPVTVSNNIRNFYINQHVKAYLTEYGELYLTGYNSYGQQGSGDTTNVYTFTKRADNVKEFYNAGTVSVYITNDNELCMCGSNSSGQLGAGDATSVYTFTKKEPAEKYNSSLFKIKATPSTATVTIEGTNVSSTYIRKGTTATWEVSAEGYETKTGVTDRLYSDLTIDVELEEK